MEKVCFFVFLYTVLINIQVLQNFESYAVSKILNIFQTPVIELTFE